MLPQQVGVVVPVGKGATGRTLGPGVATLRRARPHHPPQDEKPAGTSERNAVTGYIAWYNDPQAEPETGEEDCDIGCDPVHDASAHARYLG